MSDDAQQKIVGEVQARIETSSLQPANMVGVTAALMEEAQKTSLNGPSKKKLVIEAFSEIAPASEKTASFSEDVLPDLIDMLKLAAKGGVDLAVQTRCCGLL